MPHVLCSLKVFCSLATSNDLSLSLVSQYASRELNFVVITGPNMVCTCMCASVHECVCVCLCMYMCKRIPNICYVCVFYECTVHGVYSTCSSLA